MNAVESKKTEFDESALWVKQASGGDLVAFDRLMYRYQNMAVAYAASLLNDSDLAQDAALAAFVQAHKDLATLRDPSAFPAWLRKLVWKQCDRIRRIKQVPQFTWELAVEVASPNAGPEEILFRRETQAELTQAIKGLPIGERKVVLLFYGGDYSHQEIADFLGVTHTAVKSRLFSARKRLKERLVTMLHNDLQENRPSGSEAFLVRVREAINAARAEIDSGDISEVSVREHHPEARYRDPHPVFLLTNALIKAALAQKVYRIRLVPENEGLSVQLLTVNGVKNLTVLPEALREPVIARFKDGAGMDTENTTTPQSGTTPVYDAQDKSFYTMHLQKIPPQTANKWNCILSVHPQRNNATHKKSGPFGPLFSVPLFATASARLWCSFLSFP